MKINNLQKILFAFLASLLILLTFFPLLKTGLTTQDDMRIQVENLARKTNFKHIADTGRPLLFNLYIGRIPYLLDNFTYLRVIGLATIIINLLLSSLLIKNLFRSNSLAALYLVFLTVFLQNSWQYNLLTAYPFAFTFGFNIVLISFLIFNKYLDTGSNKLRILSAFLYFVTLFQYETYSTYIAFFIFFALFSKEHNNLYEYFSIKNISNSLKKSLVHVVLVIIYLAFYIYVARQHPNVNADYSFSDFSLGGIIKVIYQLSVSTVPTYIYFHSHNFFYTVSHSLTGSVGNLVDLVKGVRVEWLIKSLVTIFAINFVLLAKSNKLKLNQFIKQVIFSFLLIVLPISIHSLTAKYQNAVNKGIIIYVVSYFSFFGIAFLLTVLFFHFYRLFKTRYLRIFAITVLNVALFMTVLIVEYSNYYYTFSQEQSKLKWKTMQYFINTSAFKTIPEGSTVYSPTLFQFRPYSYAVPYDTYWKDYISLKTGKTINFTDSKESLTQGDNNNLYYLKFVQDIKQPNQYLVFAKPSKILSRNGKNYIYSDNAFLINYSMNQNFILSLRFDDENSKLLNDLTINNNYYYLSSNFFSKIIVNYNRLTPISQSTITSNDFFDVDSINVSFLLDHYSESPDLVTWGEGFHTVEQNSMGSWRWSKKNSTIEINNTSGHASMLTLSMEFATYDKEKSNLTISGNIINETIEIANMPTEFSRNIILPPGNSLIEFVSDARNYVLNNRELVFNVRNFILKEIKQ